jgi:hypothetical protein
MDRTVAEILRELRAVRASDVTIVELDARGLSPRALVVFEQMRARGETKQYTAKHGAHSTPISLSQRGALKRAGATEA